MKERRKISSVGIIISVCFLILGAYITVSSFGFPAGSAGYPGAGFFPRVIGIVMLGFAGMLVVQSAFKAEGGEFHIGHGRIAAGVAALTVAYLLFWGTGFFAVRTVFFIALFLRFLGEPWKTGLTVSVVMTAVITATFKYGLHLSLD